MRHPIINRYECPKCEQTITLVGGKTDSTSIICEKCNMWMRVANSYGIAERLMNYPKGDAGQQALSAMEGES